MDNELTKQTAQGRGSSKDKPIELRLGQNETVDYCLALLSSLVLQNGGTVQVNLSFFDLCEGIAVDPVKPDDPDDPYVTISVKHPLNPNGN